MVNPSDIKTELYKDGVKSVLFTVTANTLNMRNPIFQLKMGDIAVSTQPELAPGGSRVFGSVTLPYRGERKVHLDAIGRKGNVIGKHEFDLSRIPNAYSYFEGTVDLSKRGKMLGTLDIRIDFSRKRVTKVVDRTGIFTLCSGPGTAVFERDVKAKGNCCNAVVSADSNEEKNRRRIFLNRSSSSSGDVRQRARAIARNTGGQPHRPVAQRSSSSSTIVDGIAGNDNYQPQYGKALDSVSSSSYSSLKKRISSSTSSTEYVQPVRDSDIELQSREGQEPEIVMVDGLRKGSLSSSSSSSSSSSIRNSTSRSSPRKLDSPHSPHESPHKVDSPKKLDLKKSSSSSKSSVGSSKIKDNIVSPKRRKSTPVNTPSKSKVSCGPKMKALCAPKKKENVTPMASPASPATDKSNKSDKEKKRKRSGRKIPATPSKLVKQLSSCSSMGKDKASPLRKLSGVFKKKSSSNSSADSIKRTKKINNMTPSSTVTKLRRRRSSLSSCSSSRKAASPMKPSTGKLYRSCSNSSRLSDAFKGALKKKSKKSSSSSDKPTDFNKPKVLLHKKPSSSSSSSKVKIATPVKAVVPVMNRKITSSSSSDNKLIRPPSPQVPVHARKSSSSSSIRPKNQVLSAPMTASPEPAPVPDRLLSITDSTVSKRRRRSKQPVVNNTLGQRRPSMVSCASSKSGSRLSCGGGRRKKNKILSRSTSNLSDLSDVFPGKNK